MDYLKNNRNTNIWFFRSIFFSFVFSFFSLGNKDFVKYFLVSNVFLFIYSIFYFRFLPWGFPILLSSKFVFFLSLNLYLGCIIFYISSHRYSLHLVPISCDWWLSFVLVPIHIVSELLKPVSLSLRLYANYSFGYFALKFSFLYLSMISWGFLFFLLSSPLLLYEFFVFFLQRIMYVYMLSIYLEGK